MSAPHPQVSESVNAPGAPSARACCPHYHQAVELIGRRWTGAILGVLLAAGSLRFSEIAASVPQLSDRLLSQRMKELELRGLVAREVHEGRPPTVTYSLTEMGCALQPAIAELHSWAQRWLGERAPVG
jgi:DNA-binding HxlR family transcriptional regulator